MHDLTPDRWFAPDIEPPYVGFLFSARIGADEARRAAYVADIYRLAARAPGFIGAEHADAGPSHLMAAIYWRDRDSLDRWLAAIEHVRPAADPRLEGARLYDFCTIRIVSVEQRISGCFPPLHEPTA